MCAEVRDVEERRFSAVPDQRGFHRLCFWVPQRFQRLCVNWKLSTTVERGTGS